MGWVLIRRAGRRPMMVLPSKSTGSPSGIGLHARHRAVGSHGHDAVGETGRAQIHVRAIADRCVTQGSGVRAGQEDVAARATGIGTAGVGERPAGQTTTAPSASITSPRRFRVQSAVRRRRIATSVRLGHGQRRAPGAHRRRTALSTSPRVSRTSSVLVRHAAPFVRRRLNGDGQGGPPRRRGALCLGDAK